MAIGFDDERGQPSFNNSTLFNYDRQAAEEESPSFLSLMTLASVFLTMSACALVIVIVMAFSASPQKAALRLGAFTGSVVGVGVVCLLAALLVFRKERKKCFFAFSMIVLGLGIFHSYKAMVEARSGKLSDADRRTFVEMSYFFDKLAEGEELPPREFPREKYGDYAPLLRLVYESTGTNREDLNKMNEEIERLALHRLLVRGPFNEVSGIDEGRMRLARAFEILDRYEELLRTRSEENHTAIVKADIPEKLRGYVLDGFNKQVGSVRQKTEEIFDARRAIYSRTDEMLIFIKSAHGEFHPRDHRIIFKDASASQKYERLQQEINSLLQVEADLEAELIGQREEFIRQGQSSLKELEPLLRE
jgi:hypothetical protein